MAGERILIIDDNAANLKLARVLLASDGYDLRTAASAEEALAILESFAPQLILMDLQLPGIDGLELVRRLKADPARRDIVMVALTAYAMQADEAKAFAAGCDGYITKPFDPEHLSSAIRRHLDGGH